MITSQGLVERMQENVAVPSQRQRSDGFSEGILFGSADANTTGVITTFTPTLDVLRKTVASGKNVIICQEAPSYPRGERAIKFIPSVTHFGCQLRA